MPSVEDIVEALQSPVVLPLAVISAAIVLVFVAAARRRARERMRRASEIEGRLLG